MYADQLPQLLVALREQARIESVTASSALEGIVVDGSRIPKLASGTPPRVRNRSEAEFAGYSAALDYLLQGDAGEITVGLMLHLHRLLFSLTDGRGGHLKTEDNLVVDRRPDGTTRPRFTPVSWKETPFYMDELAARTTRRPRRPLHPPAARRGRVRARLAVHPPVRRRERPRRPAHHRAPPRTQRIRHRPVRQRGTAHLRDEGRLLRQRSRHRPPGGSTRVNTACGRGPGTSSNASATHTNDSRHGSPSEGSAAPNRTGSATTSCCRPPPRSRSPTSAATSPASVTTRSGSCSPN